MNCRKANHTFYSMIDFTKTEDIAKRRREARKYGIRIIYCSNFSVNDFEVISGPFWRFRRHAKQILFDEDNRSNFFLKKVVATKHSRLKLYYYNVANLREGVIEIKCKPGLNLTFCSGPEHDLHLISHAICNPELNWVFIEYGDYIVVE